MKLIKQYSICLVVAGICFASVTSAQQQLLSRPSLWFSFDGSDDYTDDYRKASYGKVSVSSNFNDQISNHIFFDRFNRDYSALSLGVPGSNTQTYVTIVNNGTDNSRAIRLFGYGNSTSVDFKFPDNFTVSCWVYVTPPATLLPPLPPARKIFYANDGIINKSGFALLHIGADIFLRRTATASDGTRTYFDYFFGAPAAFDAGAGWYHVILVMGKRSEDKARFTKLYIGKPKRVKYDQSYDPRGLGAEPASTLLVTDFGGAYTFTGVQDFMKTTEVWGLGNAENRDFLYDSHIAAVERIDDFAVWDIALTDDQAFKLFECMRDRVNLDPNGHCWTTQPPPAPVAPAPAASTPKARKDTVAVKDAGFEIEEKSSGAISIFPNPASNELRVKIPAAKKEGNVSCVLMDLKGNTLTSYSTASAKTSQTIRLENIRSVAKAAGFYLLKVITPDQVQTFKVMIH